MVKVDWLKFRKFLGQQLNKKYRFGAENKPGVEAKDWDCSELTENGLAEIGIKWVDGAANQHAQSRPLAKDEEPGLGCVRFFKKKDAPAHHVGFWFSDFQIIEARGEPFNAVILRLTSKWDAWPEATEWRWPLALEKAGILPKKKPAPKAVA